MKYIRTRESFSLVGPSRPVPAAVNEAFENDITWGGSLLGRLINSVIRMTTIEFKKRKIPDLVLEFQNNLDALLPAFCEEEDQIRIKQLALKKVLYQIYMASVVVGRSRANYVTEYQRMSLLIGRAGMNRMSGMVNASYKAPSRLQPIFEAADTESKDDGSGLIGKALDMLRNSDVDDKDSLISKLEKYRDDLTKIKLDETPSKKELRQMDLGQVIKAGKEAQSKAGPAEAGSAQSQPAAEKFHATARAFLSAYVAALGSIVQAAINAEEQKKAKPAKAPEAPAKPAEAKPGQQGQAKPGQKDQAKPETAQGKPQQAASGEQGNQPADSGKPGAAVSESWSRYLSVMESAEADPWSAAKSKVMELRGRDKEGYKNHILFIKGLIDGKYAGSENKPLARRYLKSVARKVLELMRVKHPKLLEWAGAQEEVDKVRVGKLSEVIMSFLPTVLSLAKNKEAVSAVQQKHPDVARSLGKLTSALSEMRKSAAEPKRETFMPRYADFMMLLEAEGDQQPAQGQSKQPEQGQAKQPAEGQAKQPAEDKDKIKETWFRHFKSGEEKEWEVDESEIKEFKTSLERGESVEVRVGGGMQSGKNESLRAIFESRQIDMGDVNDPIMEIVDIFGRAYNLYATEYIPSGRPGGIVSQSVVREYKFIGKEKSSVRSSYSSEGSSGDFYPGEGPWAAKRIYKAWRKGVWGVIKRSEYREILANVRFVGQAEMETGTANIEPNTGINDRYLGGAALYRADRGHGAVRPIFELSTDEGATSSGISLMELINKMLNLKGTFEDACDEFLTKYFNMKGQIKQGQYTGRNDGGNLDGRPDPVASDKVFFTPAGLGAATGRSFKKGLFFLAKVDYTVGTRTERDKCWIIHVHGMTTGGGGGGSVKAVFRIQESEWNTARESIIKAHYARPDDLELVRIPNAVNVPRINAIDNMTTYLGYIQQRDVGTVFTSRTGTFKRMKMVDTGRNNPNDLATAIQTPTNFEDCQVTITELMVLCKNDGSNRDVPVTKDTWARAGNRDLELNPQAMNNLHGL